MNKHKKERLELIEAVNKAAHSLYWELMGPKVVPFEQDGVFSLQIITDYPKSSFPREWKGFPVFWTSPIYKDL